MKSDITKELVFNHFANRITPLQQKQIDEWLQSGVNAELYYKWLEEWENQNIEYEPDSDRLMAAYARFLHTDTTVEKPIPSHHLTRFLGRRWSMKAITAASVLLLAGTGYWFGGNMLYYKTYQTEYGEVKSFGLTDGSLVTLNANSSLRVPRWGFSQKNREVWLEGEANFSVRHTPGHQLFTVRTSKNLDVEVLGTDFSVFSRQRGARVVLNKGKVRVNYQDGNSTQQLVMKPGDLISFDRANHLSVKKVTLPRNYSIWREKRFLFDQTILADVAQTLEETYGLTVTITSNELAQRKLMGSFRAENVDELLNTIAELLEISIVHEGNRVFISEK